MILSGQQPIIFDAEFLRGLKQRDSVTCTRFVFYFTPILEAKLRHEFTEFGAIEDVRNETYCRVITAVDRDQVRDPEHFGAFVRGVCARVAQEHRRSMRRAEPLEHDPVVDTGNKHPLEGWLHNEELRRILKDEISKLSDGDRALITESFLEQRDRRDMARDRGVSPSGLNVRLCRAMQRFRLQMLRTLGGKQ